MSLAYPESLPLAEINEVISIFRGQTPANTAKVAKDGWIVTGYVFKLALGEPNPGTASIMEYVPTHDANLSDEQAAALLAALAHIPTQANAQGIVSDLLSSDFVRSQLAKILLPYLLGWLQKWLTSGGLQNLIGSKTPVQTPVTTPPVTGTTGTITYWVK